MASNTSNLQLVLDNRVNVGKHSTAMVRISGANVNEFQVNADGATGSFGSQITFNNIVIPSLSNTVISRNVMLRYNLTIIVNASGTGVVPAFPVAVRSAANPNAVLRAFPLNSVCDTISATFNGQTVTINARQTLSALQRRIGKDYLKLQATTCPCQADNVAALVADGAGQSNQVLSNYWNSDGTTRASFLPYSSTNAAGVATYNFEICESICLPPFSLHDEEVYFSNINTLSMVLNYSNIRDMVVGVAGGFNPANLTSVVIDNPRLVLKYITVSSDIVQIPRLTSLPFEVINYQPKALSSITLNPASGTQVYSDNLRFNSMPSLIYLFCRIPIASRNGSTAAATAITDTFTGIGDLTSGNGGLSISIGTRTGLLANASLESLYRMSKRNGLNCSYNEWQFGGNGVIILDPVEDLGVDVNNGDILPGESGNVNFLASMTINGAPYAYAGAAQPTNLELMVIPVYSGVMTFTPDNAVANIGELNPREVDALLKTAPKDGSMVSSEVFHPTVKGAGFFSKFKSILSSGANAVKDFAHSDLGKQAIDLAAKKLKGGALVTGAGMRY